MNKNYLLMLAILALITTVAGRNMFKCAGKDVESAGEGVPQTVDHNE